MVDKAADQSDGFNEREIDEVLAEFGGDARAAIRALLVDLATLAADADAMVSRGYVWGRFLRPRLRVVGKIG